MTVENFPLHQTEIVWLKVCPKQSVLFFVTDPLYKSSVMQDKFYFAEHVADILEYGTKLVNDENVSGILIQRCLTTQPNLSHIRTIPFKAFRHRIHALNYAEQIKSPVIYEYR